MVLSGNLLTLLAAASINQSINQSMMKPSSVINRRVFMCMSGCKNVTSVSSSLESKLQVSRKFQPSNDNNSDLFYVIAFFPHQLPGKVDPRRRHYDANANASAKEHRGSHPVV
jgi:hypothetical protein